MHDGLAQTLSYLGLQTDQAAELLQSGQVEPVLNGFEHIRNIIGQASQDVRRSIASLQDQPRPLRSLQEALRAMVDQVARESGSAIVLTTQIEDPVFIPRDQMEQVLRVVREGLVNAGRHAQAQRIAVDLNVVGDEVTVTVQDDGRGFDPDQVAIQDGAHFGLSIMRARAARIAGEIKIDSLPGQGTRVILTWPSSAASDNAGCADERHPLDRQALPML
jgi:two-component system nitrate/nitrite sensor histidine kinase NarX